MRVPLAQSAPLRQAPKWVIWVLESPGSETHLSRMRLFTEVPSVARAEVVQEEAPQTSQLPMHMSTARFLASRFDNVNNLGRNNAGPADAGTPLINLPVALVPSSESCRCRPSGP